MFEKIECFLIKYIEKKGLKKFTKWYRKRIEVLRYLLFGLLTTAINIIVYSICFYVLIIENLISNIIAWVVSVVFAYITNRKYVFASKATNIKAICIEVLSFFASRLVTFGIDEGLMFITVNIWQWNGLLMKIVSNVIVIILNYIFSKVIIFKKK